MVSVLDIARLQLPTVGTMGGSASQEQGDQAHKDVLRAGRVPSLHRDGSFLPDAKYL